MSYKLYQEFMNMHMFSSSNWYSNKQKWKGWQSGTYPRHTKESSGLQMNVTKTAFLSSRIEETKSKVLSAAGAKVEFGGLTDVETGGV